MISVTGGAQDFEMDKETVDKIFQGVARFAMAAGACIVDGGTDAGVMKLMGEAVQSGEGSVDLIGVGSWGTVIGRDCMMRSRESPTVDTKEAKAFYSKTRPNSFCGAGLDPNHDFFILVDNGTVGKFGAEFEARAALENCLRNPKHFDKFTDISCLARTLYEGNEPSQNIIKMPLDDLIYANDIYKSLNTDGSGLQTGHVVLLEEMKSRLSSSPTIPIFQQKLIRNCLHETSANVPAKDEGRESPETAEDSSKTSTSVNFCSRCKGSDHCSISLKTRLNSIPQRECDGWSAVQSRLAGDCQEISASCSGCHARIERDDFLAERFYPCPTPQCGHFFFRSRVLELRRDGRSRAMCHACNTSRNVDDVLGKFVPGVLVVVQGGPGTITTVASANAKKALQNSTIKCTAEGKEFEPLEQNRIDSMPIVVVEGSGKAADFIAATWRHMHEGDRLCYGKHRPTCVAASRLYQNGRLLRTTCPFIESEYTRIFGGGVNMALVGAVIETCRGRSCISLYNPTLSKTSMAYAIMLGICRGTLVNGQRLSIFEQLRLIIDWVVAEDGTDSSDALSVLRDVLANDSEDDGAAHFMKKRALMYALRRNSPQSVELLVDAGISVPKRDRVLKDLYPHELDASSNEDTLLPNNLCNLMSSDEVRDLTLENLYTQFKRSIHSEDEGGHYTAENFRQESHSWNHAMHHILNLKGSAPETYFNVSETDAALKDTVTLADFSRLVGDQQFEQAIFGSKPHVDATMRVLGWARAQGEAAADDTGAESDLFIWAILMGRKRLAGFFWRRCPAALHPHCISRALFASSVAHRMVEFTDDQADKLLIGDPDDEEVTSFASVFEDHAQKLMQRCGCFSFLLRLFRVSVCARASLSTSIQ